MIPSRRLGVDEVKNTMNWFLFQVWKLLYHLEGAFPVPDRLKLEYTNKVFYRDLLKQADHPEAFKEKFGKYL